MLLDDQARDALNVLDRRLDVIRLRAEDRQVIAEKLDPDLGLDPGNHVRHEMLKRLLHFNVHAGHLLLQFRAELPDHLLAAAARLRVDSQDELGLTDRVDVLVQFGAAGKIPTGPPCR